MPWNSRCLRLFVPAAEFVHWRYEPGASKEIPISPIGPALSESGKIGAALKKAKAEEAKQWG